MEVKLGDAERKLETGQLDSCYWGCSAPSLYTYLYLPCTRTQDHCFIQCNLTSPYEYSWLDVGCTMFRHMSWSLRVLINIVFFSYRTMDRLRASSLQPGTIKHYGSSLLKLTVYLDLNPAARRALAISEKYLSNAKRCIEYLLKHLKKLVKRRQSTVRSQITGNLIRFVLMLSS